MLSPNYNLRDSTTVQRQPRSLTKTTQPLIKPRRLHAPTTTSTNTVMTSQEFHQHIESQLTQLTTALTELKNTTNQILATPSTQTSTPPQTHQAQATLRADVTPTLFSGMNGDNATNWITKYERYSVFYNWDPTRKCIAFPLYLDDRALRWYNSLTDEIRNDYAQLSSAFTAKYVSKPRSWEAKRSLDSIKQGPLETVDDFAHRLLTKIDEVGVSQENAFDFFINGLRSDFTTHILLQDPTSLDQAISVAKRFEQTLPFKSTASASQSMSMDKIVDAIANLRTEMIRVNKAPHMQPAQPQTQFRQQRQLYCSHCNMNGHTFQNCRNKLRGSRAPTFCDFCKIPGHDISICRNKQRQAARYPNRDQR